MIKGKMMKKLFVAMSIFALSTSAFAGFTANSTSNHYGMKKSQSSITTVAKAKRAYDDTYVTLRGNIVAKIGKETYRFKDNTGSIRVEIDNDVWRGLNISSKDTVTLYGKIDRDDGRVEIDVKRISR